MGERAVVLTECQVVLLCEDSGSMYKHEGKTLSRVGDEVRMAKKAKKFRWKMKKQRCSKVPACTDKEIATPIGAAPALSHRTTQRLTVISSMTLTVDMKALTVLATLVWRG